MTCEIPCPREVELQHPASPGPVADDEIICRGGFGPSMHYKPNGGVKPSLIRSGELRNGTLSFWRGGKGEADGLRIVEDKLRQRTPERQTLQDIFGPHAIAIRELQLPELGRLFSVVDDCATDEQGGSDPLHCGVRLCCRIVLDRNDEMLFAQVRDQLLRVLLQSRRPILAA
jgi:hypothetical protein